MRYLRLLMILSVFLSIAHTSAIAGTHAILENELLVSEPDTHSATHEHCCTEDSVHTPDCHIFAGLLPAQVNGELMPEMSSDGLADNGIMPDGFEPTGPLDPPRSV